MRSITVEEHLNSAVGPLKWYWGPFFKGAKKKTVPNIDRSVSLKEVARYSGSLAICKCKIKEKDGKKNNRLQKGDVLVGDPRFLIFKNS